MSRPRVAVLGVHPHRVLDDVQRLCGLAGLRDALDRGAATILKDNISWHYPFPGANTTPWQLEGAGHSSRTPRDMSAFASSSMTRSPSRLRAS